MCKKGKATLNKPGRN